MTNQNLLDFHHEIQSWYASGSVLPFLNRSKIKEFYKINDVKIDTLQKKIEAIYQNYFVYETVDGDANKQKVKFVGEGKERKPVFLLGKKEDDFQKELSDLTSVKININF